MPDPTVVIAERGRYVWALGRFRAEVWRLSDSSRLWMYRVWDVLDHSLGGRGTIERGHAPKLATARTIVLAWLVQLNAGRSM